MTDRQGVTHDVSLPPVAVMNATIARVRADGAVALPPLLADLLLRTE